MNDKSFFTSYKICRRQLFALLLDFFVIAMVVFDLYRNRLDICLILLSFNIKAIIGIFAFYFLFIGPATVLIIVRLLYLPSVFSRMHITEEGLYCTAFNREIKRIKWSEITDCIALVPGGIQFRGMPFIIYSQHPITQKENHNYKYYIYYKNGKKNDLFFLPYTKEVLHALPKEYRPKRVYRFRDIIPPPEKRKPFRAG